MTEQQYTKISVPRPAGAVSSIAPAHTEDEFNGLEAMLACMDVGGFSTQAMKRTVPGVTIVVLPSAYQPSWMAHQPDYDTTINGMKRSASEALDKIKCGHEGGTTMTGNAGGYNRPDVKIMTY